MRTFDYLSKGSTPTFLDHVFANRVLRLLNAVIKMKIAPAAGGKVVVGDDGVTIDLTGLSAAQQAAQIEALQKSLAAQQAQLNAIIASLKTATITCTDGHVVLVLTKLP